MNLSRYAMSKPLINIGWIFIFSAAADYPWEIWWTVLRNNTVLLSGVCGLMTWLVMTFITVQLTKSWPSFYCLYKVNGGRTLILIPDTCTKFTYLVWFITVTLLIFVPSPVERGGARLKANNSKLIIPAHTESMHSSICRKCSVRRAGATPPVTAHWAVRICLCFHFEISVSFPRYLTRVYFTLLSAKRKTPTYPAWYFSSDLYIHLRSMDGHLNVCSSSLW